MQRDSCPLGSVLYIHVYREHDLGHGDDARARAWKADIYTATRLTRACLPVAILSFRQGIVALHAEVDSCCVSLVAAGTFSLLSSDCPVREYKLAAKCARAPGGFFDSPFLPFCSGSLDWLSRFCPCECAASTICVVARSLEMLPWR